MRWLEKTNIRLTNIKFINNDVNRLINKRKNIKIKYKSKRKVKN